MEDLLFLRNAAMLSEAQVNAARQVTNQEGASDDLRSFATRFAERHQRIQRELETLSQHRGAGEALARLERPRGRVAEALQRISQPAPDARGFLATQLAIHPVLVEMYQTEAAQTTYQELGRFAITTLVGLQEDFTEAARLGQRHGIAPSDRLLSNPPQYGPGAGPMR
jgi:hypothetical protein